MQCRLRMHWWKEAPNSDQWQWRMWNTGSDEIRLSYIQLARNISFHRWMLPLIPQQWMLFAWRKNVVKGLVEINDYHAKYYEQNGAWKYWTEHVHRWSHVASNDHWQSNDASYFDWGNLRCHSSLFSSLASYNHPMIGISRCSWWIEKYNPRLGQCLGINPFYKRLNTVVVIYMLHNGTRLLVSNTPTPFLPTYFEHGQK